MFQKKRPAAIKQGPRIVFANQSGRVNADEARPQSGGRCRVRTHQIGKQINVKNPRERKRDMQKSIAYSFIKASYSFSRHI